MEKQWWKDELVTSAEELKSMVGQPNVRVANKIITHIDSHVASYLSLSPLFFLATCDAEGRCDVSPRGDEPGFVKVMDDRTLIFPERPGNRRVDSLLNIVANPRVGMVCVIPGLDEVVRINGKAWLTRSAQVLSRYEWTGKMTGIGVVVEVEECFMHCSRAFQQSGIWDQATWPPQSDLPSMNEMYRAHLLINGISSKV